MMPNFFLSRFREPRLASSPFPRTILGHRAGYPQNHCCSVFLEECHLSIGVVCGSDNHMLVTIHTRVRLTTAANGAIKAEPTQSDLSVASIFLLADSNNHRYKAFAFC